MLELEQITQIATAELKEWATSGGFYSWAADNAKAALAAVEEGTAFIVPCTHREFDAPGYNALAQPAWDKIPLDHPISAVKDWGILFAPFSANAPGRVGKGRGAEESWMVIVPYEDEE